MKKLIVAAFALSAAVGVFAQGTINLWSYGDGVNTRHYWGPSSTAPSLSLVGQGTSDTPAGTINYAGAGMKMIGEPGGLGAATTFAQLLWANGTVSAESSLLPAGATTTFRTGGTVGRFNAMNLTIDGLTSTTATVELVAWDNSSGLYNSWTTASAAWQSGLIAAGGTGLFTVQGVGGFGSPPSLPPTVIPNSFNLFTVGGTVPEPTTLALAGLGAVALLIFRRK